jgi:MFS family permease
MNARGAIQRLKEWWPWILVAGALGLVYWRTLTAHITRGFDPRIFNDDVRQQIYPFFRYADSSLFPNDYIADYYLACLPIGFRALYTLSAPLIDPSVSNKIVMYLTLLITVAGLGVAANRLGGKVAAWGAMALVLGASLYMGRMGGGLPRAFGFPILACALAALSYGRTKWLAVLVWSGACFYPVAGVIVGMTTTFVLLLPASDRGDAHDWGLWRRLRFLSIVAGVSIVLLLPTIVTSSTYAPVLTIHDASEYPEAGPGGRYAPEDLGASHKSFFDNASRAIGRGFIGVGKPWIEPVFQWVNADKPRKHRSSRQQAILNLVAVFTVVGWMFFVVASSAARRVLMFGLAAFIGYSIAGVITPYFYLPTRYTTYPIPLLAVLMASTSVAGFFSVSDRPGWETSRTRARLVHVTDGVASRGRLGARLARRVGTKGAFRAGVTFVFCLLVLVTIGGRGTDKAGLNVRVRNASLYDAIAELPVDAVIAGWPFTAIENVPYVSRRAALLTYETHQAFHKEYADEMRERMRSLIDATLATSNEPLIRLRDEHGVTHMLVYLPHLRGGRLKYFKPFNQWVVEAQQRRAGEPLSLQNVVDNHAIYRRGDYAIVDLRDLSGES